MINEVLSMNEIEGITDDTFFISFTLWDEGSIDEEEFFEMLSEDIFFQNEFFNKSNVNLNYTVYDVDGNIIATF
jgi:hypothetical protein